MVKLSVTEKKKEYEKHLNKLGKIRWNKPMTESAMNKLFEISEQHPWRTQSQHRTPHYTTRNYCR